LNDNKLIILLRDLTTGSSHLDHFKAKKVDIVNMAALENGRTVLERTEYVNCFPSLIYAIWSDSQVRIMSPLAQVGKLVERRNKQLAKMQAHFDKIKTLVEEKLVKDKLAQQQAKEKANKVTDGTDVKEDDATEDPAADCSTIVFDEIDTVIDMSLETEDDDPSKLKRKRKSKKPLDIVLSKHIFHDPEYDFDEDDDLTQSAQKLWQEVRWSHSNLDAVTMLSPNGEMVKQALAKKNFFHFIFGDVPWGCLKSVSYDNRFNEAQVRTIVDGIKLILHHDGTCVIRLGPNDLQLWRDTVESKQFYVQPTTTVAGEELWCNRKGSDNRAGDSGSITTFKWLIFHQTRPHHFVPTWYESKELFGALTPHGKTRGSDLWMGVPHVPNAYKLQAKDGSIFRIPENHIMELCELIHRFCPKSGSVLDFCSGTATTMLACMMLNRVCRVNDIDQLCMTVAISRAKKFLKFIMTKFRPYPEIHTGNDQFVRFDGIDIYKEFYEYLTKTKAPASMDSLYVPPTNQPTGSPTLAADVAKNHKCQGLLVMESH
jgi:hypothetical protein